MHTTPPAGARFEFDYGEECYLIEFLDDERLRWTRTTGDPVGTTDIESYVWTALDRRRSMVTWIEADGLGLSSVVEVEGGTLVTHANTGRDVFVNSGATRRLR